MGFSGGWWLKLRVSLLLEVAFEFSESVVLLNLFVVVADRLFFVWVD